MDKRKYLLIAAGLILSLTTSLIIPELVSALECRIIRIRYQPHFGLIRNRVRVEPSTLVVSKGTCVVWVNSHNNRFAKVIFYDGTVRKAVTNSTGFKLDENNRYVTSLMPHARTSRLTFVEKGTFVYNAIGLGGHATGVIVVRSDEKTPESSVPLEN